MRTFQNRGDNKLLLLQDVPVMEFNLERFYCKVLRPDLLPFYLRGQIKDSEKASLEEIIDSIDLVRSFFSHRFLSLGRDHAKQLCSLFGINQPHTVRNRALACLKCHAVSASDSYWVKESDDEILWKDVNVRKNKITSIIEVALDGQFSSTVSATAHPDLTTGGSFRKSWVQRDNKLFLVKSDQTNDNLNTRMEVLASEILDCFENVNHVKYWGEVHKTATEPIYTCVCENYCTEELSTVHALEVIEYCRVLNMDFKRWALNSYKHKFANIAVLDYVLLNTDRHVENYGFYFDNTTGEIIDFLPLYDHNLSLISDLAGTAEQAANSLSLMFYEHSTLKQLAFKMKPFSKLKFNNEKFNQLQKEHPEYIKVFDGVVKRLEELL